MATIDEERVFTEPQRACQRCGHISAGGRYCAHCGYSLDAPIHNGDAPTVEQSRAASPSPIAYPPPSSSVIGAVRSQNGSSPSAPPSRSRARTAAIVGVTLLVLAAAAVAVVVIGSNSGSGSSRQVTYRRELTTALAPVVTANKNLSSALQSLHGSNSSPATTAASQAQQAVSSARGALTVLSVPSGSAQLSQQVQQALTDETGYVNAVLSTLSGPDSANIAQLQPLVTALQSAFVPLLAVAPAGGSTISATPALTSWASARVAAAAKASAAANRAAQRKDVQAAARKAAQQAVSNSGGTAVAPAVSSGAPAYGIESLPSQCGYGVAGSAGVSCPFAENAFYEYWSATGGNPTLPADISAWSAEGQTYYALTCGSGDGVVDCTGTNSTGVFLDARFTQASVAAYTQSQADTYAASGKPGPNG